MTHWFYLYIVWWFPPFVLIALLADLRRCRSRRGTDEDLLDRAARGRSIRRHRGSPSPMGPRRPSRTAPASGQEPLDGLFALDADHTAARAGHPDVGDVGGAAGSTRASAVGTCVCVPTTAARGRRGASPSRPSRWSPRRGSRRSRSPPCSRQLAEQPVGRRGKGMARRPTKHCPLRLMTAQRTRPSRAPCGRGRDCSRGSSRAGRSGPVVEERVDLAVTVDVVSGRDHVRARVEDFLAVRSVMPSPPATFSPLVTTSRACRSIRRQDILDRLPSRLADDVADERIRGARTCALYTIGASPETSAACERRRRRCWRRSSCGRATAGGRH